MSGPLHSPNPTPGSAPSYVGSGPTRVLLAALSLPSPLTVRAVARKAGVALGYTHAHLCLLREAGLVTWDEGRQGTLRPLVRRVR